MSVVVKVALLDPFRMSKSLCVEEVKEVGDCVPKEVSKDGPEVPSVVQEEPADAR